jgi:hypothetical protein
VDEKFYSVTTILNGGVPKGEALTRWVINQTIDFAINRRKMWNQILDDDPSAEDEVRTLMRQARWKTTGKAMARGTDLHNFAEAWVKGLPLRTLDPEIQPYANQFQKFCDEFQPEFKAAEASVYNHTYGYAGTLDTILNIAGTDLLVDYKTTGKDPTANSRPPYPEVSLQLAAYRHAEWIAVTPTRRIDGRAAGRYYLWDDQQDRGEPMPAVDGAACLMISPYDYRLVTIRTEPFEDDRGETHDPWKTFLFAREIFRWAETSSRLVIADNVRPETATV